MYEFQFWTSLPILLAVPPQVLFILLYSVPRFGAGKWWTDFVGQALFIKSASLTFIFVASAWTMLSIWRNGQYTGVSFNISNYRANYAWLLVIGYWMVSVAVWYQCIALIEQRRSVGYFKKRRM